MRTEHLNEPLAWVEARFEKAAVSILRFEWRRRRFEVVETAARWVDRQARPVRFGFSVTVPSGEVFELIHVSGDPVWLLATVTLR